MTSNGEVGRQKRDRDEVFVEFTKSICPVCKATVDAQVNIRDNKVYLRKRCREHGWFEALIYGDAEQYLASARFNKPGTLPLTFQTEVDEGCPSDCGLCPEHKQQVEGRPASTSVATRSSLTLAAERQPLGGQP